MKVTAMAVLSLDGKLTRWGQDNIYEWSSKEDHELFLQQRNKSDAIVMGRRMYEIIKPTIDLTIRACRFIMTTTPDKYKSERIENKVEFTNASPSKLLKEWEARGLNNILHVGGAQSFGAFMKDKLIDELFVTIEPRIFGEGGAMFKEKMDVKLKLLSSKKINKEGALFLHYRLLK